jgi:hypothetical protein
LALAVGLLGRVAGFDRDRAFYPTVLIVIALYYALFAVMGGSVQALLVESLVIAVFVGAAIAGFGRSLWLVFAGFAAHGMFDFVHGRLIANPGVPLWWPNFCLAFDLVAAAYLALLLRKQRLHAAYDRADG